MAKPKILVCAHDAGGANLLFHWAVRAKSRLSIVANVEGPAASVFSNEFPEFSRQDCQGLDAVIASTGWQSDFEFNWLQRAKENQVKSISYLDHWVNFESRFIRNQTTVLPDQLWCADGVASEIASSSSFFKNTDVRQVGNYYWQDIKRKLTCSDESQILLLHEPIRDPNAPIDAILQKVRRYLAQVPRETVLVFRPHPSGLDSFGEQLVDMIQQDYQLTLSHQTLDADLSQAQRVIGYLSTALALSAWLHKETYSFYWEPVPEYLRAFGVQPI